MYADVEIISNNTYKFNIFTYFVPKTLTNKITIGSVVEVKFRNKLYKAIVLNLKNDSSLKKINDILNITGEKISQIQLEYLKYISLSNYLNIGILLKNLVNIKVLSNQKILKNKKIENLELYDFKKLELKNKKNLIFAPSLKEISLIQRELSNRYKISFYQKAGGKEEFNNFLKLKDFQVAIVLSNNFENINITSDTDYYFYDSNSSSYKLPKLNQLNIIESAYLKNRIFGGNFYFINEFQNLEFNNKKPKLRKNYQYQIEYFISSTTENSLNLLFNKIKRLNFFSNDEFVFPNSFTKLKDISNNDIDALVLINPKIARNNILDSSRLIYLIRLLNYFSEKNKPIYVVSNKELNINNTLNSNNFDRWVNKEIEIRKSFGPNLLMKIFSIKSNYLIKDNLENKLLGPINSNDRNIYELHLKLINVKYLEIINLFSKLTEFEVKRVRYLWVKLLYLDILRWSKNQRT